MMLGREDDVLDSRPGGFADPVVRIEFNGIEFPGEFCILFIRHAEIGLKPFTDVFHDFAVVPSSGKRIEPPVNEHTELPVAESLHCICHNSDSFLSCF